MLLPAPVRMPLSQARTHVPAHACARAHLPRAFAGVCAGVRVSVCVRACACACMRAAGRGCVLERVLSLLRCLGRSQRSPICAEASATLLDSAIVGGGAQLVAMSATLPNLEVLGKWLGAATYRSNVRPVPLAEWVVDACG
eukprot:6189541-Pleurochrysis_carterae.AAC.4